jgi:hypothetical protein
MLRLRLTAEMCNAPWLLFVQYNTFIFSSCSSFMSVIIDSTDVFCRFNNTFIFWP